MRPAAPLTLRNNSLSPLSPPGLGVSTGLKNTCKPVCPALTACLDPTAGAVPEALCSSPSQMVTPALRLPCRLVVRHRWWFTKQPVVCGGEHTLRRGQTFKFPGEVGLSVLQIWFAISLLRRLQACTVVVVVCATRAVTAAGLKLGPLCCNPSLRRNKSNRAAIFETASGNSCRCRRSDEWYGRGASLTFFFRLIPENCFKRATNVSTFLENPRQNGTLFI